MTGWIAGVRELPAIALEEVDRTAALQTRVDRKYLLSPHAWHTVLGSFETRPRVLEIDGRRSFGYASVYYDTPDLVSYRDAAHRRPRRFKVRTRHYVDTGARAIEVKLRSASGTTSKERQWLDAGTPADADALPAAAVAFVGSFERIGDTVHDLTRVLSTSYERVTLVTADARVTVDRDVAAEDARGARMDYGDLLVVETKSPRGAGAVDRALWAYGIRPARISKYCTSLAALRPDLPANRWSRTLRRYVPTAARAAAA